MHMNTVYRSCNRVFYSLTLLSLILLPRLSGAAPQLEPFEIDYDISSGNMVVVEMKRRLLQLNNGDYRFESTSRPTKLISWFFKDRITEYSLWQWQDQHLRPLHYHYRRNGGKVDKHIELNFDWRQARVSDTQRTPVWSSKLQPLTSDKLLYQLQLMMDLQAGKDSFDYTVADSGKFRHYHFTHAGSETIELPLGKFETVKLYLRDGKRTTTIWCALALNYMPVRIDHVEKDDRLMRAEATRVQGLPLIKQGDDQQ